MDCLTEEEIKNLCLRNLANSFFKPEEKVYYKFGKTKIRAGWGRLQLDIERELTYFNGTYLCRNESCYLNIVLMVQEIDNVEKWVDVFRNLYFKFRPSERPNFILIYDRFICNDVSPKYFEKLLNPASFSYNVSLIDRKELSISKFIPENYIYQNTIL
jgi:hypothetical protein